MRPLPVVLFSAILALLAAPLCSADDRYPSLRGSIDEQFQQDVESVLASTGLNYAARRGELGLAVADITDIRRPRVAAINGDKMFYAASLPKIAILLGAFVEADQGRLTLDADTRECLTRMIRNSSNVDATEMLRRVGHARVARILQSDDYRLYDPEFNGGLWVGKDYGKSPAWRRDPLYNLSHAATALQAARFYYLLESGQLVSDGLADDMKDMLSEPAISHKFVKGLEGRDDVRLYRKSGTWRRWHSDSAIVEHDNGRRYIVVGLTENSKGGQWLSKLIAPLDDLMMRQAAPRVAAQGVPFLSADESGWPGSDGPLLSSSSARLTSP